MPSEIVICSLPYDEIYRNILRQSQQNAYVSYIRGKRCVNEDAFFCEISASLQFPYYFGENWPAFDECICDLEWLQFNSIFLIIDDFSIMFNGDEALKNRLLKYFAIMIQHWKENNIPVTIWLNN